MSLCMSLAVAGRERETLGCWPCCVFQPTITNKLVGSSDCKSKFLSTFLYRSSESNSKKNKKGYDVPRFDNFQHGLDVSYIESIRVHLDRYTLPAHP
jgi:hypothetical protein